MLHIIPKFFFFGAQFPHSKDSKKMSYFYVWKRTGIQNSAYPHEVRIPQPALGGFYNTPATLSFFSHPSMTKYSAHCSTAVNLC